MPDCAEHSMALSLGETWLGPLGVLEWWVGLATVKKHTGREGVFCCEFHRKAQHEKYLRVLIWCCLRRWLGLGLGVVGRHHIRAWCRLRA